MRNVTAKALKNLYPAESLKVVKRLWNGLSDIQKEGLLCGRIEFLKAKKEKL